MVGTPDAIVQAVDAYAEKVYLQAKWRAANDACCRLIPDSLIPATRELHRRSQQADEDAFTAREMLLKLIEGAIKNRGR